MSNNQDLAFERDFYVYLNRVLVSPEIIRKNSGELKSLLDRLRFSDDGNEPQLILENLHYFLNVKKPVSPNMTAIIAEIERSVTAISQLDNSARASIVSAIARMKNETYVNRVKTSDKQQRAVTNFIKG